MGFLQDVESMLRHNPSLEQGFLPKMGKMTIYMAKHGAGRGIMPSDTSNWLKKWREDRDKYDIVEDIGHQGWMVEFEKMDDDLF